MGPETIALAAITATKTALQGLLKNIATEAARGAGAFAKSTFKNWQTDQAVLEAYARSKQVRRVKTIWDVEKERDLVKFYYPSKVRSPGEKSKVVNKIDDFDFDGNLIIRGIVGQGKSIFLRYLAAREFELGERIPVFIELRRIEPNKTVVDAVIDELKNLGLAGANVEIVEYLVRFSRLVLLLDVFDEVVEEQTTGLVKELENLSVRLPKLRILVTSRAENAIERSPHFRVVDLAPLVAGEFAHVIARIRTIRS
jgi:predicted NACHT family NTPase